MKKITFILLNALLLLLYSPDTKSENIDNNNVGNNIAGSENLNESKDVRISIKGNHFVVGSERIWLNGVNTPWNKWNDFGGSFDYQWWDNHFKELRNNGINSSRIWISCDSNGAIKSDENGVTGLSETFFKDCDSLFAIAKRYGVYIKATMISFDHCKDTHKNFENWRNIINNQTASQTFIDIYLLPFVNRYKSNPYLFAIDLCNEPEWISENKECGQLPVINMQRFFAMCAVVIHENSDVPVTIGSACVKWNSDNTGGYVGNYWKDSALKSAYDNPKAYLDFYSVHYYGWVHRHFKSPFELTPEDYGINDKPVLVGEMPAKDSGFKEIPLTLTEAIEKAYEKGYQGAMPWTSNGVDRNGNLETVGPAALSFKNKYPKLVYPVGQP